MIASRLYPYWCCRTLSSGRNRITQTIRLRFSAGAPRITKVPKKVAVTYDELKKVEPYAEALRLVGLEPVLLSAENEWSLEGLDGLLLTGGRDLDPRRYGQEAAPET